MNDKRPNKAPEPTPTSVTLRAIVPLYELNLRTEIPFAARSAPAVVVAHLDVKLAKPRIGYQMQGKIRPHST